MRTADQPIRISLIAPHGRMGKALARAVEDDAGFAIDQDHSDVLVDFSAPGALSSSLERAVSAGVPILVGTTGLGPEADQEIAAAAKRVAVLRAANTSLGVAVLAELVGQAARLLSPDWDIEIVETHHRMKADAPSGTALSLGHAAARGRGADPRFEMARNGTGLSRTQGAIGFAAVRGGTVAGDHEVRFLGPGEQIALSHRAESRMIFAKGALTGARFLFGQKPGLYSMHDVIRAS
jgi:4-hydroxy-tetrahydrodipicolinate reductase